MCCQSRGVSPPAAPSRVSPSPADAAPASVSADPAVERRAAGHLPRDPARHAHPSPLSQSATAASLSLSLQYTSICRRPTSVHTAPFYPPAVHVQSAVPPGLPTDQALLPNGTGWRAAPRRNLVTLITAGGQSPQK